MKNNKTPKFDSLLLILVIVLLSVSLGSYFAYKLLLKPKQTKKENLCQNVHNNSIELSKEDRLQIWKEKHELRKKEKEQRLKWWREKRKNTAEKST